MSTVTLVPNKKTGAYFTPSTNGKWFRLQVTSTDHTIRNGFETKQNRTGFLYVQTEERAKEYVAKATANNMQIAGKVIYVDQLQPIQQEALGYGMQYPYPMRFNGQELTLEQKLAIQQACVENGLPLMGVDTTTNEVKPIYRRKIFTDDLTAVSTIITPVNMDAVNTFIATILETSAGTANSAAKEQRLKELQAIPKAQRTPEQKAELAELLDA